MKKVLILVITFIIALLLYIWVGEKKSSKPINLHTNILEKSTATTPQTPLTTPANNISEHPVINIAEKENYLENQSYAIFEELDIDAIASDMTPIADVDPISALRMKQGTIKEIEIGDTIRLPSIEGMSYELSITHKEVSSRGNVSIDGSFSENGVKYTAILTEGSKAAFISMNTPEGTYEIELLNGIGYVYANSDINKAKIDYTKTDEVTVHREEH